MPPPSTSLRASTVRRRGSEHLSILGDGVAEFVSNPCSQLGDTRVAHTKRDVHNRSR